MWMEVVVVTSTCLTPNSQQEEPFSSEKHVGQLRRYKKIATRDTKRGTQDRESVDTKSQWMLVIIVSTHPILHIPQGDLAC